MKIAIMQPTFFPWSGYFALMEYVDIFVFLDHVQFNKRSWQQRNKIYCINTNDVKWLTVPILSKNLRHQKICEAKIDNSSSFRDKHYKFISQNYSKSKFFNEYKDTIREIIYKNFDYLSEMNIYIINKINKLINIKKEIYKSSDLKIRGEKSELLINICKKFNIKNYISVEGSKEYIEIDKNLFLKNNINVDFFSYKPIKYKTFYKNFIPNLSIIDILLNCGPDTKKIIMNGLESKD